jgi:hypothetical protein
VSLAEPSLVTWDSIDPPYDKPFVDVDERRIELVPHRYVNGGFEGTHARFSFYVPRGSATKGVSSTTPIRSP